MCCLHHQGRRDFSTRGTSGKTHLALGKKKLDHHDVGLKGRMLVNMDVARTAEREA
jgi:hypothetical protein